MGLGEFFSLASALAWAIAVILFKRSGESLAPFALNLFKNTLALVLLAVTIVLMPGPNWPSFPPMAIALMLLSGLIGIGLGDTLYFRALNQIGAARLGIAGMLYSPFVILLSTLFLGEQLLLSQWGGVAAVLLGVALVNRPRDVRLPGEVSAWVGVGYAVASVAMMAVGIVIAKPLLEVWDFLWVVQLRLVGGLLGMGAVICVRRNAGELLQAYRKVRHWPQVILGSLMGTYVAMMLWLAGYKYTLASVAAILNEMAAVFILILAAIFLGDRLRGLQLVGVGLACAGVSLVVWA